MSEATYDEEIAPALLKIVERCKELGMPFVSHVEYAPGETGITQHIPDSATAQMHMTWMAAHCHGNFDALAINVMRRWPEATKQCVTLHHFRQPKSG